MLQGPKYNPRYYGAQDGDYHLVVSAATNTAKMYRYPEGNPLWEVPALPTGQHANWRANQGDTPPGTYKLGDIWRQYKDNPSHYDRPYGHICFDMVDLEGHEDDNGRGGVAIHGGGSGLPGTQYWDKKQPLLPTHGCVRMHNEDLYKIEECYEKSDVYVSVYQDDK